MSIECFSPLGELEGGYHIFHALPAKGQHDGKGNDERMVADAVGEHLRPGFVLRVTIAKAENDEGEPAEEEQSVQQRTAGKTACDAPQGTLGSRCCKQNRDEDNGIDSKVAKETRVAKGTSKGKYPTLLYHALHHQTAEGAHHQTAVQAVVDVAEEPAQALVVEDATARNAQS